MPSGLYVHIPFCKSRCIYCEFYSQTEINTVKYSEALLREAEAEHKSWAGHIFDSLYFGGGTPSLMSAGALNQIVKELQRLFCFASHVEITLECNPDDISESYAKDVVAAGINRVSIGIQSFDDPTLRFLSRRHDGETAERAVRHFQSAGLDRISIDLIYGIPGQSALQWKKELEKAVSLHVKHISCYMLTSHENTRLCTMQNEKIIHLPGEEDCYKQFLTTLEVLEKAGISQYEISNFACKGNESVHNRKYWSGAEWLGLGPSAHSCHSGNRWANPADTELYVNNMIHFIASRVIEKSDEKTRYNEYVMNRIRTREGINHKDVEVLFPAFYSHFNNELSRLNAEWFERGTSRVVLTAAGMFVSDYITGRLFV